MPQDDETRVVITGLGAVCALGRDLPSLWSSLLEGRVAAGVVPAYEPPSSVPAEAIAQLGRAAIFALDASIQALADAGLAIAADTAPHVGLVLGSAFGEGPEGPPAAPAGQVAGILGLRGPSLGLSAGGVGGAMAVGLAADMIRHGQAVVALAGGCEAPLRADVQSRLAAAGLLSPSGVCRPLDAARDGTVLSEGAAVLLLERLDVAQARGAAIYGEVVGFGASSGASDAQGLRLDLVAAGMAIQRALSQKPLLQGEIDVYWAWAPGHREQDLLEAQAVRRVYGRGAFQLYVTASKGATGYLGAASGALEVALAARALREGVIPPAAGCESPDPRVELDIVRGEARRERLSHVMCYSYGLGGHHACIILGRIASNG